MKSRSIIFFTFFTAQVFAQSTTSDTSEYQNFWQYGKEVGINVTPLLRKFVPFNLSPTNNRDNLLALKTKWYGKKLAFILNFGADLNDNNDFNSFFLSLGYERRRNISEKWKYTTGWEASMITVNEDTFNDDPALGLSKPYGIEYHFYDNFYLATEARLFIGITDEPVFKLFLPSSIYFCMLLE